MSTRELSNTRRRSRSPPGDSRHKRSRSPYSHRRRHHHHSSSSRAKRPTPVSLPFQASPLSKHAFDEYEPMFGLYLEIQKQRVLEDLPVDEVKGRWKSFVGKWNRGELAEGWYDPTTLQKAQASAALSPSHTESQKRSRESPRYGSPMRSEESSEEDIGPTLPSQNASIYNSDKRAGPAIPTLQDLELKRELEEDDSRAYRQDIRYLHKVDHKQQKEHIEELVPRAEAGSKDRILEKKREKADSNRAFASAKTEAGGVEEVPERDLLGDEDGGIEGYKKQKKEMDRKKSERDLRREEILRARNEEREERMKEYRAKEEKTMAGLVALAKARFG